MIPNIEHNAMIIYKRFEFLESLLDFNLRGMVFNIFIALPSLVHETFMLLKDRNI
jgi:hypothetical protein